MESELFEIEYQDGDSETIELEKVRAEDLGGACLRSFQMRLC